MKKSVSLFNRKIRKSKLATVFAVAVVGLAVSAKPSQALSGDPGATALNTAIADMVALVGAAIPVGVTVITFVSGATIVGKVMRH